MTNHDNNALPELPEFVAVGEFVGYGRITGEPHVRMSSGLRPGVRLFTEDQLRAYGELCRRAAGLEEPAGACQVLPEGWRVSIERGSFPGVMWLELNGPKCSTSDQAHPLDDVKCRVYEKFEDALANSTRPTAPAGNGGERLSAELVELVRLRDRRHLTAAEFKTEILKVSDELRTLAKKPD